MHPRLVLVVSSVLILGLVSSAAASTWADREVTCPVCGTVNLFKVPASYGSYVYQDPSRFQFVFWPATTQFFLYTCKRCHLTTYMHDFSDIPPAKIAELAAMLERDGAIEGPLTPYHEIPMASRLDAARKVYRLLGRDDTFWCEFGRIAGYHLAESGLAADAHEARGEALALAESLLERAMASERKEVLVIVGAMRLLTGDVPGAREAMDAAGGLRFDGDDSEAEGFNNYLDQLIEDFSKEFLSTVSPR